MKIAETTVDLAKIEDGAWVGDKYGSPIPEMGDLCLKMRGANNKAWRKLAGRLIDAVPRSKRIGGRLEPADQDRINAICLRDTSMLDWENLDGDDDKPLPFSKDAANKYLTDPKYGKFRDGALWAAQWVADQTAAETEADAKN